MLLSSLLFVLSIYSLFAFALPSPPHPHSSTDSDPHPRPRIIAYYPDWAHQRPVDYSLFDIVVFSFAVPDQNYQLAWDDKQAPLLLSNVVSAAHARSTKVMLSLGGWTGSRYFSDAVANAQNRETFANNILDAYKHFNLDGIDIDWEYPGQVLLKQGNKERASDTANLLEFAKVLHEKLPSDALISAAVQDSTFVGSDGLPMKDVSAFSKFIDWITLMNYDSFATRQPPGPNAPLYDGCGNSSLPIQSAVGGYKAWTDAGFPPSKIILGVPAYGYIINSGAERLSQRSAIRVYPTDTNGHVSFRSLIDQGALKQDPNGSFVGSGGFFREWDRCSATPYLRSASTKQVIPYDDPESLGIKAAWVKKMGMGGINIFAIDGDTSQHHLTHALLANLFPNATQGSLIAVNSSIVPPSMSMMLPSGSVPSSLLSNAEATLSSRSHHISSLFVALPGGIIPGDLFSHKG